jgi:VWFA-related protein
LRLVTAVAFVCASISVWGARQQGRFQSGVELVVVPVSVTAKGKPVTGLGAEDFALTDNGVRQTVEAVSLDTLPIDVTLLLDTSSSVRGTMLEHLKQAVRQTAAMLTPRDRLRLISVQHMIHEVVPWQAGGDIPDLGALTASGSTSLFDGVAAAMMRASPPDRRHLIVMFTDGRDTSSVVEPSAVQEIAASSDTVVHAVIVIEDLRELRSDKMPPPPITSVRGGSVSAGISSADEQQLPTVRAVRDAVVAPTGGQVFPVDPGSSVGDAFTAAVRAFRTSYVLRYSPAGVTPGGWHNIAVSVTRSGRFDVRARKGYGGDSGSRMPSSQ